MSLPTDPAELLTVLTIVGLILGALFFIIDARLVKMSREFRPNGGTSVRDQLNRIEAKLDGHLDWHIKGGNRD